MSNETNPAYKIENRSNGVSRILGSYFSKIGDVTFVYHGRDRDLIIDTGMGLWPIAKDITALNGRSVIALFALVVTMITPVDSPF